MFWAGLDTSGLSTWACMELYLRLSRGKTFLSLLLDRDRRELNIT